MIPCLINFVAHINSFKFKTLLISLITIHQFSFCTFVRNFNQRFAISQEYKYHKGKCGRFIFLSPLPKPNKKLDNSIFKNNRNLTTIHLVNLSP